MNLFRKSLSHILQEVLREVCPEKIYVISLFWGRCNCVLVSQSETLVRCTTAFLLSRRSFARSPSITSFLPTYAKTCMPLLRRSDSSIGRVIDSCKGNVIGVASSRRRSGLKLPSRTVRPPPADRAENRRRGADGRRPSARSGFATGARLPGAAEVRRSNDPG